MSRNSRHRVSISIVKSLKVKTGLLIVLPQMKGRDFTVDDLTEAYRNDPGCLHQSKKAARQFVYRTMLRLIDSGDLTRVVVDGGWPQYRLTPQFFGRPQSFSAVFPSVPLAKAEAPAIPEVKIASPDPRQSLQERLNHHKLEMLTAMGETEEYDAICKEIPELRDQVQVLYNSSRDKCSKLLGKVKALESLLARGNRICAMKLRRWQSNCVEQAFSKFQHGDSHFLCLATPGAGKTAMAATLVNRLLTHNIIDLVLCFSPSIIVSSDFQDALKDHTGQRMDGSLGARGCSLTYQSMLRLDQAFWELFNTHRVLVIFDEIHHCAGDTIDNANAWGQTIIRNIQGRAAFTLALTGTPWRSDRIPIALASYCQDDKIHCDYIYGLAQAIKENVCRAPSITLIDNDRIQLKRGDKIDKFSSFAELLSNAHCSYQQLIDNDGLILYLLKQSVKKLTQIRRLHPTAGGLIVAASVDHAHKIASLLERHLGQRATIATYLEDDAHRIINTFRNDHQPWIISVGMISEGTNIPRLRVCCHLTRVKTELHFRQVLGRILRVGNDVPGDSYLYLPAEPNLVEYARRVAEEIPESAKIKRETMSEDDAEVTLSMLAANLIKLNDETEISFGHFPALIEVPDIDTPTPFSVSILAQSYDTTINMFGRFRQELLQLSHLYAR